MGCLRFLTAGESHGQCLTAILEGLPAGLRIDMSMLNSYMAKRQQGYGRGGRMNIETDKAEILSGVRFGETLGDPISVRINNRDWQNWQDRMSVMGTPTGDKVTAARPGHADYIGVKKYARKDIRDILERASARETAARVAVGGLAKQFLAACGIMVSSEVLEIGGIKVAIDSKAAADADLNCRDEIAAEAMKLKIRQARQAGDTLGGIFSVVIKGVPLGLGSHIQWDKRLDGKIAGAMMSIQAIKGVEIGSGFDYAHMPGSLSHDEMFYDENGNVYRETNHAGGLEGGMTNGEDIIIKAVMKPIPTLMQPLHSIDIDSKEAVMACKERSDVCAVPAASIVGEAMMSFVLAEAMIDKFPADNMEELLAALDIYRKHIQDN